MNASDFSETGRSDRQPVRILELTASFRPGAKASARPAVTVRMVYVGVEREQIPHLRVRGLNHIEPFGAMFNQEVGIAKTK